jgi:phage shock protein A
MKIMKRIKRLLSAKLNDLIDKAEDPEVMLNQAIREIDAGIMELRGETASAMAAQKLSEKHVSRTETEIKTWLENARTAVKKKDDGLAVRALERKQILTEKLELYKRQLTEEKQLAVNLKSQLLQLEDKAQEARGKRDLILTKKRAADSRQKLASSVEAFDLRARGVCSSADQIISGFDSFDRFEEQIERSHAEAEARLELAEELSTTDLERQFSELNGNKAIQDELDALKKKAGK